MSNLLAAFRCPCCNEELDDYEVSMYDLFEGMREECYNKSLLEDDDNILLEYDEFNIYGDDTLEN